MDGNSRHQVIKRLQARLPRGAPFDLTTLTPRGVSPQLAARYAESGWLVRLAHGVCAFPNDEFGVYEALKFLQQRVPGLLDGLHVAASERAVLELLYEAGTKQSLEEARNHL